MAIREVVEDGQKFFEVYVDVKSKFKKSARVQKRRKQIRGLREAQQIEEQRDDVRFAETHEVEL